MRLRPRAPKRLLAFGMPLMLLAQCGPPACEPPGSQAYPLKNDFSLTGAGIEVGKITSCYRVPSEVDGRENICRIIDGYEELDQPGTYVIDGAPWGNDNTPDADVLAASGSEDSTYGMTVVVPGYQYEGCTWESPTNNYVCDYRASKHVVLRTGTEYDYVLRKLWDWGRYAGNTAGCAQGIVSVWRGGSITFPFLAGCADGPL